MHAAFLPWTKPKTFATPEGALKLTPDVPTSPKSAYRNPEISFKKSTLTKANLDFIPLIVLIQQSYFSNF